MVASIRRNLLHSLAITFESSVIFMLGLRIAIASLVYSMKKKYDVQGFFGITGSNI